MLVSRIDVQHVRAHKAYSLPLASNVTLVMGTNGSGKTSLIEALYIALQGSSFKGTDSDVLARHETWYRIDVKFHDDSTRSVKFDSNKETGRKQFIVDSKVNYRLLPQYKHPIVLFEPDDLRLLSGSPARRRQFIDRFIAQLDSRYSSALRRYERALKQRNAILKSPGVSNDSLFAWDVSLSEYGAYIISQRLWFIGKLNDDINNAYNSISHTSDRVEIAYSQKHHDNMQQKLLAELHSHTERDKLLGFTSVGPHRDDVLFYFNSSPALAVASRGEARSIILALKFLEVSLIEAFLDRQPIVLLDDVFSELDKDRQDYLIDSMKGNQIIITSATNNSTIEAERVVTL